MFKMKIVYKIISILLGIGTVIAAFKANIFTLLSTPAFGNPTKFEIGFQRILKFANDSAEGFNAFMQSEGFAAIKAAFIAAAVFFFLAALCGLLAAGFGIFTDKPLFNIIFSASGIISLICSSISIGSISKAFASGAVAVTDFLDLGLLGDLASGFFKIGSVTTSNAYLIMGACLAGLLIWALCFVLTEVGAEPKSKKKKSK